MTQRCTTTSLAFSEPKKMTKSKLTRHNTNPTKNALPRSYVSMNTTGVMAPFMKEPINGIDEIIEMAKGNS